MKRTRRPARRRWWPPVVTAFALIGAGLLVLSLVPELQARHQWLAMAVSFAPYGWLAWLAAAAITLVSTSGRRRLLALPLALGLAGHSVLLLPYLPDSTLARAARDPDLTVIALNLRFGLADLQELATQLDRAHPDVVVLTEVTRSTTATLDQRGWRKRLPYRIGTSGDDYDRASGTGDATGTMVLSRRPLAEAGRAEGTRFTNLAVRFDLDGRRVTLIAGHPANPTHSVKAWLQDGQGLAALACAHTGGPLIVAGDLNATAEHLTLRNLIARTGLTDAASGQGWHPTYPADRWFGPVIAIDHVLASKEFGTLGYETVTIAGTDHLGLLVRFALR